LLLPMGRLSDIVGRKQLYVLGFFIFASGAIISSLAGSIVILIIARICMGLGAAMTQGTGMAMIVSSFPASKRGRVLGLSMSVVGLGGVVGPSMGGFVIGAFGWRAIFIITALLSSLAMLVASTFIPSVGKDGSIKPIKFDWLGAVLSSFVLVTFLLSMTYGPKIGWNSSFTIVGFLLATVLAALFIWWELRVEDPMLDVRLFKRKLFFMGVTAGFISFLGMHSVRFLMPFYLQVVMGYSPTGMGLILVPNAVAMIIAGPLGGRLSDRYGWTTFNVGGLLVSSAGLFILATINLHSSLWIVMTGMIVHSIGTGTFNAPNNSSILSTVEENRYGVISGLLNLIRNSAGVTGIATSIVIITASMASMGYLPSLDGVSNSSDNGILYAFTSGLRLTYLIIGSLVLAGAILSIFKGKPAKINSSQILTEQSG